MNIGRGTLVAAIITAAGVGGLILLASCSSSTTNAAAGGVDASVADSGTVPDAGTMMSLPDSAGTPCDPVKQDCADPSLKCTYIKVGSVHKAACEPSVGDSIAQEGDSCTRVDVGFDNCVKGTHCFPNGGTDVFACRKACATDSQCATGSKCAELTDVSPYFGVCYPTCTPFGTDCGGGTCANSFYDNDGVNTFDGCRNIGALLVGQSCGAQWDCAANMNCFGMSGFTCHLMCDTNHPCGDAGTCTADPGLPNAGGTCQ